MTALSSWALRVAVVTETYPPEINGVANTMRQLVSGLARRGHRITLIRPRQHVEQQGAGEDVPAEQVLVPGLPLPGYRGLRLGLPVYWRLRRQWGRGRPDVVYIATQGPLGRAALRAARAGDIPVLTGFHTQFHQYSRFYGLGVLMHPIIRSLRRFHNRSDGTLVPTAALGRRLRDHGFSNVQVFGRGVDTRLFSPSRRSAGLRAHWGCGEKSVAVLYVGRIAAEKNIDLALKGFAAISARRPDARLVVVGDGPERARLCNQHPDYIFTGPKVGVELAAHYASADLFLFPSLTETFGNVVPEAMASGLAVVAFDDAAAHEHIRPWHNGLVVAAADERAFIDAAVAAAGDRGRLVAWGAAARTAAEALSWERVIGGLEQRLLEVIHRHRNPGERHESVAAASK